nr:unnamed protein product [Spirometra erinaceieuropaei]
MGMRSAFSAASADFSGITGSRDLFIASVFHKATIEVDEEGAEAAAATEAEEMLGCSFCQVPKFIMDHPFLLFIVSESGLPVFMGHVVDEEGAEAAAATEAEELADCLFYPVPQFIVDHPFLLFIVSESGLPVFMGHVVNPEPKQ